MLKLINKFLNKLGYVLLEVDALEVPDENLQPVYIPVNISMSVDLKEYIKTYKSKYYAYGKIIHISAIDFSLSNENLVNVTALKEECLNLQNSYGDLIILNDLLY